jgi:hypothetical protein
MKLGLKYFCTATLLITVLNGLVSAQITNLCAGQSGSSSYVDITWECGYNDNIAYFEVYRSNNKEDVGRQLITPEKVFPNQDRTSSYYKYRDGEFYRAIIDIFYYRVKIVYKDGSSVLSSIVSTSYAASTAKRTWGSIKAMFR